MFLCNKPQKATAEALEGFCFLHYDKICRPCSRVVMQKKINPSNTHKIATISGGGAGHEPFAAGFVGRGMLTSAVSGDLFASPPTNAIVAAINSCLNNGYEHVLLIVNNYTGDRLTFGLAQRRASNVTLHVIADDCTTKALRIGARGLAGNLFHYKIAGAMADNGSNIEKLTTELNSIKPRVQTIGVCMQACMMPGKEGHILEIEKGWAELGLGVHGEAGVEKVKVSSCNELVGKMIAKVMESVKQSLDKFDSLNRLALLVNNLGGLSQVEMSIVLRAALQYIYEHYSVCPVRVYSGIYMTSLDAKGFSISIFAATSDLEIEYLDAECDAPVWVKSGVLPPPELLIQKHDNSSETGEADGDVIAMPNISPKVAAVVVKMSNGILSLTERLNFLDGGGLGDGDTGSTLAMMCTKLLEDINNEDATKGRCLTSLECIMNYLYYASRVAETKMGGTSGGLYAFALQSAGDAVKSYVDGELKEKPYSTLDVIVDVVDSCLWAVQFLGGAQPGDRSLVDPLDAVVKVVDAAKHAKTTDLNKVLLESIVAAEKAAEATSEMKAHVGRAAAARDCTVKSPDPGAVAFAALWKDFATGLL